MAALCAVCVKPIYDDKEDSIFCEGVCKDWIHRTCAGLSNLLSSLLEILRMTIFAITVTVAV